MTDTQGTSTRTMAASIAGWLAGRLPGRRPVLRAPGGGPDGGSWYLGSNGRRQALLSDRDVAGNLLVTGSEGPGHTGLLVGLAAQAMARGIGTLHVCADNVDDAVAMTVEAAASTGRSDDLVVLDWINPYTGDATDDIAGMLGDASEGADPADLVRRARFRPPEGGAASPRDLADWVVRSVGSPHDHPVPAWKKSAATQAKASFRNAMAGARLMFVAVPHHYVSSGEMLGNVALECLDATLARMPAVTGPVPRGLVIVDCKDFAVLHDLPGFVGRANGAGFAVILAMRASDRIPDLRDLWPGGHDGLVSAFPTWVRVGTNLGSWADVTFQPAGTWARFQPMAGVGRDTSPLTVMQGGFHHRGVWA